MMANLGIGNMGVRTDDSTSLRTGHILQKGTERIQKQPELNKNNRQQETQEAVSKTKALSLDEIIEYAKKKQLDQASKNDPLVRMAKKIGAIECQTCANREYQDVSNDAGVSFKNAAHISPENAFAVVSAHEQEHVEAAKDRASRSSSQESEREFLGASVRIFVSTCPECGRTYVSGGETRTMEAHSSSHNNPSEINLNDPSVAFYNRENNFNAPEGQLFHSLA